MLSLVSNPWTFALPNDAARVAVVARVARSSIGVRRTSRGASVPVERAKDRNVPAKAKMDVMTKLAMWGVDVERMRSGRREPTVETSTTAGGNADARETANDEDADDAADVDVDAADTKIPVGGPGANDPPSANDTPSARVLELLARQEAEHWPAQGSDEWLLARARIVSASEASAALGVDRFRSPEKLIRDKLARLDHLEAVPRDALAAAAESFDAAAREKANDLGWRANGGKKGDKNARKKKRRGKRGRGGVGGRRFAGANELQRVVPGGGVARVPPAVAHGNAFEPVARAHYARVESQTVHEFGLKIHDTLPWLGATPDGVVASGAILEIKCPYSRPVLPRVRAKEHYPQLQVLMQVFDVDECHFVQYKPPGTGTGRAGVMNEDRPLYLRETVSRDRAWWAANQPRLKAFHERLETALRTREERLAEYANGIEVLVEEEKEAGRVEGVGGEVMEG